jgi:CBS domain-containing protein
MAEDRPSERTPEQIRIFTRAVLRDLQALERMLSEGLIEKGPRRFGAEQEFFLVGDGWRPAPISTRILERLRHPSFTPELALFNLEANLPPEPLGPGTFARVEGHLVERVALARAAARAEGAEVVLCGHLPTLVKSDLTLENITPNPRYYALNEALSAMRGGAYQLRIEGTDELMLEHDSVMLEACNTSCQVHLQVAPEEFVAFYNAAQLVAAPVLAAAVNSPVLFGRRLWAETRIALFQQSLDTRSSRISVREMPPRVRFGESWVRESITELYAEDLARFRVILPGATPEDPMAALDRGELPKLEALQLYNSTIYRWNRPCFGVSGGSAHIRIESRALAAGPSVLDEVANAALWTGAVLGVVEAIGDPAPQMPFSEARRNFLSAAREGLSASFRWVDGERWNAPTLIRDVILPLARRGLARAGVAEDEIERYLGVIDARVASGRTGAQWILDSLQSLEGRGTAGERMAAITAAMVHRQVEETPVHTWPLARLEEAGEWTQADHRVEQYMNTRPVTINEDELLDLAAFVMDREGVRLLPVEDADHRLVGLLSYRGLLRRLAQRGAEEVVDTIPVREVMEKDPITITPQASTLEAIEQMRRHRVACLPVVQDGRLVGLVTERDFMAVAYELLVERIRQRRPAAEPPISGA